MVDYVSPATWAVDPIEVIGREVVSVGAVPAALTVPDRAELAILEYVGEVRVRLDGTAPDSSDPVRWDRDVDRLPAGLARRWRAVRVGVTNGTVSVTYLGRQP